MLKHLLEALLISQLYGGQSRAEADKMSFFIPANYADILAWVLPCC